MRFLFAAALLAALCVLSNGSPAAAARTPGTVDPHIDYPTSGTAFAKNATVAVEASWGFPPARVLESCYVYMEITSTDAGNTYYFGDSFEIWNSGATSGYFATCNALPPGNYKIRVWADYTGGGSATTITFTVNN